MEWAIVLGAIILALLIVGWVFKLIKNTVKTILLVAFLFTALYVLWGIGPADLWEQLQQWLGLGQP
ncbi:hypothetical protein [Phormidium sp. FACHB-1136]|jgi:hypothetical protein|uniref:hypothetical protein n=1 Tax=Phormidium sp. FACHB-1136 TaxID=2692848 RepID=UPI0016878424|nr:hypothetical protein [Phormidium sp. FACHB-1136]MBD2425368.1 hypothetical protein [Phormidium sp. FACHB-1136]